MTWQESNISAKFQTSQWFIACTGLKKIYPSFQTEKLRTFHKEDKSNLEFELNFVKFWKVIFAKVE